MYAVAVFMFTYVPCCAHVFETCLPYSVGGGRTPFREPPSFFLHVSSHRLGVRGLSSDY
jgi:hypothetical protein